MVRMWSLRYLKENKKFSKGLLHKYGQNKNIKTGTKIKKTTGGLIIFSLLFSARRIFII
tara:strand:- start:3440 stop:3616 length:177 start_codon:yes stop_codon:yes gene_type:complete